MWGGENGVGVGLKGLRSPIPPPCPSPAAGFVQVPPLTSERIVAAPPPIGAGGVRGTTWGEGGGEGQEGPPSAPPETPLHTAPRP